MQEDPATQWRLDHSHGGPGCDPALKWQPETWKRALVQPRKPSTPSASGGPDSSLDPAGAAEVFEVVLPTKEASLMSPRLTIRHARDPELEEKNVVHRLNKSMEKAMALHAIGESSCSDVLY